MGSRYDSRTTVFSPEGRLFQVEYAMMAIDNAGACVGILAKDGVVIAAEKKATSKLLAKPKSSEKLYMIDDHIACAVAGLTSDANVLIDYMRRVAQNYRLQYQESQPIEQLIQRVCDLKQGYTQFGGQRPFGVSFLYAGWDRHFGFQLYESNPSGNYGGWKATAIGANNQAASSLLKKEYKDECSIEDALELAVKVLNKTMDTVTPTPEKMEFSVLKIDPSTGKLIQKVMQNAQVQVLLDKVQAEEKAEKEKEEAKAKS
uniref:Proteasome subunit alpha type n=1 Tax=Mucochytrium quahogii TaxID=96639 RepID=A0A7S2RIX5_9STRA|mmetsp:Transcript_19838/g.32600  ORF Transcript_19838/g.32600 Transcript_19838/m.32600 type:complete len:259 (+) Transcript_19838:149-925(+)|eukprot:CAMPEP_0203745110 /NCGR_PEP_ID=MMETSP0098-20131031/960_1 /ASSEMBLY_ACC=CAM_ASM_000208 /TAXON_ID=96639 /ORGANISM=" , Strain NY0313808BC1" /LENGTH=258 /DNA_ID=CAMNT_0050632805 /DNA_START=153 /DNA_END=929 /DNA_ORIENTATION=-